MAIKLGVVMDPIASINIKKDTTYAMILEAQQRGWQTHYMEPGDLFLLDNQVQANTQPLTLHPDKKEWVTLASAATMPLSNLDVILMRKDPPFDTEYLNSTYLLELAQSQGTLVINDPRGVRDVNEKFYTQWFPQCIPPTFVGRQKQKIKTFLEAHHDIVVKPLNEMGGRSIFRLTKSDPNISVVLETLTHDESKTIIAQKFIPEISKGDKRVIVINGEPVPYALARVPAANEFRGNLAAGGTGHGVELTRRDRWICDQVSQTLKEKGLLFVGLDIIGDYLTEINVTSPTCVRELDIIYNLNISATLLDVIENKMKKH